MFDKYEGKNAYHWKPLYEVGMLRQNPRLHARYDIPIRILSERLDISDSEGLDVGCGDGVLLYKVRKMGGKITGLDYSSEGIKAAKEKLTSYGVRSKNIIESSCYDMPFKNESFDYVTSTEVIEHLEDVGVYLNEIQRVLRPGGLFVCTTPNREEGQSPDEVRGEYHEHEFIAHELSDAMDEVFEKVNIFGAYPEWLDSIYIRGRRSKKIDTAIRIIFRSFSLAFFNPYEKYVYNNPNRKFSLLVGLAKKIV